MFARALTAVHVCLRCQRRLNHLRNPQLRIALPPARCAATIIKRWQSQAAAQVEEAEEDEAEIKKDLKQSLFGDYGGDQRLEDHELELSRRNRLTKQFHLAAYQDLGVDVLGQPAGIILLPEATRHVPIAPDTADVEPVEGIHETLQLESQPITWTDVKQRITDTPQIIGRKQEDIFAEADELDAGDESHESGTKSLSEQEWGQVRLSLYSGFTSKQLKRYIEESDYTPTADLNAAKITKKYLIRVIARDVWGYHLPTDLSEEKPYRHVEVKMNDGANELDILLMRSDHPLRKIANDHHVQIDVFRKRGYVRISGSPDNIGPARKEITLLKQSVKKHKIVLSGRQRGHFKTLTSDLQQSFLQKIRNKYGIIASMDEKQQDLEIFYSSQNAEVVDNVRRDVILAARNVDTADKLLSLPSDLSTTIFLPFSMSNSAAAIRDIQWPRVTSTRSTGLSNSFRGSVSKADRPTLHQHAMLVAETLSLEKPHPSAESSKNVRQEISARFGQALFERSSDQTPPSSPSSLPQTRPRISTQIPFLHQILAHLQNHMDQGSNNRGLLDFQNPERSFEMRLAPCNPDSISPWIHVRLRGTKRSYSGLDQALEVTRVMAVSEEKRSILLLPSSPVDIIFSNKLTRDLFVTGTKSLDEDTANLLQGLANYMNPENEAAGSSGSKPQKRRKFQPFVKLPIPSSLSNMSLFSTSGPGSNPKPKSSRTSSKSKSKSSASSNSNPVKTTVEEYVLMSIDPLDTMTFPLPHAPQFSLEHSIYPNSVTANVHAQSQNLKLIQTVGEPDKPQTVSSPTSKDAKNQSSSSAKSSKTKDETHAELLQFFDCALEVANQIGVVGQNYSKSLGSLGS